MNSKKRQSISNIKSLARYTGISGLYWLFWGVLERGRWMKYKLGTSQMIRSYVKQCHENGREIWLQIGANKNSLSGWLNTDYERYPNCAFLDVTQPWPFADGELSLVLAEHVIANLPKNGGAVFLQESYRCLRPGGVLRVSTPNLTALSRALISDGMGEMKSMLLTRHQRLYRPDEDISFCDLVNDIHYMWGHQYLYTEEELYRQLQAAGFAQIERATFGHSHDPRLADIDRHQAGAEMAYIDLIVEVVR